MPLIFLPIASHGVPLDWSVGILGGNIHYYGQEAKRSLCNVRHHTINISHTESIGTITQSEHGQSMSHTITVRPVHEVNEHRVNDTM